MVRNETDLLPAHELMMKQEGATNIAELIDHMIEKIEHEQYQKVAQLAGEQATVHAAEA